MRNERIYRALNARVKDALPPRSIRENIWAALAKKPAGLHGYPRVILLAALVLALTGGAFAATATLFQQESARENYPDGFRKTLAALDGQSRVCKQTFTVPAMQNAAFGESTLTVTQYYYDGRQLWFSYEITGETTRSEYACAETEAAEAPAASTLRPVSAVPEEVKARGYGEPMNRLAEQWLESGKTATARSFSRAPGEICVSGERIASDKIDRWQWDGEAGRSVGVLCLTLPENAQGQNPLRVVMDVESSDTLARYDGKQFTFRILAHESFPCVLSFDQTQETEASARLGTAKAAFDGYSVSIEASRTSVGLSAKIAVTRPYGAESRYEPIDNYAVYAVRSTGERFALELVRFYSVPGNPTVFRNDYTLADDFDSLLFIPLRASDGGTTLCESEAVEIFLRQ